MTEATIIIAVAILITAILAITVIAVITGYWLTKAKLLGARPTGTRTLGLVITLSSLALVLMTQQPAFFLIGVPGLIVGATLALISVMEMDDHQRQLFLRENSGRYINLSGEIHGRSRHDTFIH